ncbi:DUF3592 domain-containing protein [Terriglobus sp.]|uniref:DUF3592 domain-containing protein n=1 Tax=Terriglobus sp. TaxID=1889013 RepID=UPI003AFFBE39
MTWQRKRDRPFIRAVFLLVGVVALGIGVWQSVRLTHLLRHAIRTTGHAVARAGDPAATDSGAHPDIEFTDLTGKIIRYNQNGMGSRRVGTPIPVLYDPAAPADTAVANAFWQLWWPVLLPIWLGFGFTASGLWGEVYSNLDRYLSKPNGSSQA